MRARTTATLFAIVCGLAIWSQSNVSAQESFEETSDFAEYVMFGYPRLEGLDPYDMIAARMEPEIWNQTRGIAQGPIVDFSYGQRSITTANRQNGLLVAPGVMVVGDPISVGIAGSLDGFSFLTSRLDEISLDPTRAESDFRSRENGRLSALHVLRNNWGISGRLKWGRLFGLRLEHERASFEHGLVSGTGDSASITQTTDNVRGRTVVTVELGLASLIPAAGSLLPDSIELGIVNRDDLTPEGYTALLRYANLDLVADLGGGYGHFRNVLFGNARLDILSLAAATSLKVEYRLDAGVGVEVTQGRFGIDWISYLVWLLDDEIELRGTGLSFLGMEYAQTPSDIAARIDRSTPPPWSLFMRIAFGGPGSFLGGVFYLENNLSGWVRMFADAENTGWITRFGIYIPSFRGFL